MELLGFAFATRYSAGLPWNSQKIWPNPGNYGDFYSLVLGKLSEAYIK
jgi:hypothetical protein